MTDIDDWRPVRKKPVEVEFRGPYTDTDTIETIEGDFEVDEAYINDHGGYVLIRGVEGEVYPCGLDIFRETYEQVTDEGDASDSSPPDWYCRVCGYWNRHAGSTCLHCDRERTTDREGRDD